ncbi:MAG: AAA family ATPase [Chloroflexi bacterium]|nr:AAA family ATPase [Chloroflexota bacterium]
MLKRLELHGFKSFPSRVTFEFDRGITVLVGPNGSGKSNVADAVRWVLGEQSLRTLRGKRSEDVIFVGSSSRHAVGMAEVALVLQDEGERMGVAYHDLRVARRLFRNGESEYLINGARVRLRDVVLALVKLGLHADGYTVIGQGAVEELVMQRPEERRAVLEHAADISRHQARLNETRSRLSAAQQNLTRSQDVVAELEPHARRLRGQAERAERFSSRRDELVGLATAWFRRSLVQLGQAVENASREAVSARDSVASIEARAASLERELRRHGDTLLTHDTRLEEARERLSEIHRAREAALGALAASRERLGFLQAQIASLETAASRADGRAAETEAALAALPPDSDDLVAQAEQMLIGAVAAARTAESAVQHTRQDLERIRQTIATTSRERAALERRVVEARSRQEAAIRHAAERASRRAVLGSTLTAAQASLAALRERSAVAEGVFEAADAAYRDASANREQVSDGLQALRDTTNQRAAQLALARTALAAVTRELKAAQPDDRPAALLATSVAFSREVEPLVAAAIGEWSDACLVPDSGDPRTVLGTGDAGRRSVLPESTSPSAPASRAAVHASAGDGAEWLLDRLDGLPADHPLRALLRWTLVVSDFAAARAAAAKLQGFVEPWQIVSEDGWVVHWHGGIARGVDDRAVRILGLRRRRLEAEGELQRFEETAQSARATLLTAEQAATGAEAAQRRAAEQRSAAQVEVRLVRRQMEEREQEVRRARQDLAGLPALPEDTAQIASAEALAAAEHLAHLDQRLERLRADESRAEAELLAAQQVWQQEVSRRERLRSEHAQAESSRRASTQAVERQQRDAKRARDEAAQAREQRERLVDSAQRLGESTVGLECEAEALRDKLERHEAEAARTQAERQAISLAMRPLNAELRVVRASLSEALDTREHTLLLEREALAELRRVCEEADSFALEWGVSEQSGEVQLRLPTDSRSPSGGETVPMPPSSVSLNADGQCRLDGDERAEVPEPQFLASEPLPWSEQLRLESDDLESEAEIDMAGTRRRIMAQQRELRGIGRVSDDVVAEYQAVRGRLEFLQTQQSDLHHTIRELEQVIVELEALMREGFSQAFARVNAALESVFARLFGGGTARLLLTEPADPLRAGIEIVAQPPGKRLQSIMSLSGGERSLTSVALIFALLSINPLPFCVLDEVDAALDESNARRFATLLEEHAARTQFVVITHNRATMEIARALYGITMGGDGVTTVLSLRPRQASPHSENGSSRDGVQSSLSIQ